MENPTDHSRSLRCRKIYFYTHTPYGGGGGGEPGKEEGTEGLRLWLVSTI